MMVFFLPAEEGKVKINCKYVKTKKTLDQSWNHNNTATTTSISTTTDTTQ